MTDVAAPAPRPRRARGAAESLGSIVLAFESIIVFLGGLAIFGLKALPESIPQWWGIVAGAVLAVLMILTGRVLRYRWGIILGWVLQVIVALGGFLVPGLFLVAIISAPCGHMRRSRGLRWMRGTRASPPKPTPRTETDE